jgi:hypothetical protein
MRPETFPHYQAVHDYAKVQGLEYAWEGTAVFEERLRTVSPDQFQIVAVHVRERTTQVMLFSPDPRRAVEREAEVDSR